jgi:hypothetical protein
MMLESVSSGNKALPGIAFIVENKLEAIYSLSPNGVLADQNKALFSSEIKGKEKTERVLFG